MLKEMVRFKRPYITWDIWGETPPLVFPPDLVQLAPGGVQQLGGKRRLEGSKHGVTPTS